MNNSQNDQIRLGLVGASKIAAKILPTIRSVSGIQVIGIAAGDANRAGKFAESHKLPRAFASYSECIGSADMDAVYISTLNSQHADLIRLALQSGKHVLCEKPLVLSAQHAEELFALAREKKLILQEGLMYRCHPQMAKIRDIIQSGVLGQLRSISTSFCFCLETQGTARRTRRAGGGATTDLGCYCIDFINSVVGTASLPEINATGILETGNEDPVDSRVLVTLHFPEGIQASIDVAINHPASNVWEIRGSRGAVSILRFDPHGSTSTPLILVNDESESQIHYISPDESPLAQFGREFQNFAAAVRGTEKPLISADESLWNARVLENIRNQIMA